VRFSDAKDFTICEIMDVSPRRLVGRHSGADSTNI